MTHRKTKRGKKSAWTLNDTDWSKIVDKIERIDSITATIFRNGLQSLKKLKIVNVYIAALR